MNARHALVFVLTLVLGGSAWSRASADEKTAPQQPVAPAPEQGSKAEADAARKAARARMARCKEHPEVCRQQPAPK